MVTRELSTPGKTHLRASTRSPKPAHSRQNAGPSNLSDHTASDGASAASSTVTGRHLALAPPQQPSARWQPPSPGIDPRRLERDLHDSVHTELVCLILRLKLAEEDELTPPALAGELADLGDHACAVLDALREIIHGLQPIALSRHGVVAALKARAGRSPIPVTVSGAVPRSTNESEEAVYFACSEAIQNTIKHAGPKAKLTLRLRHEHRTLSVRAQDDGCGFDPAHRHAGSGLRNITDRIKGRGGDVELSSTPGLGTLLVISVPWPPQLAIRPAQSRQHRTRPTP